VQKKSWVKMGDQTSIIKIFREEWADPDIALPAYESTGAAGADIRANFSAEKRKDGLILAPMGRGILPSGLRMEIPHGLEVQIRARSGLAAKHGIGIVNGPGTIDSDYRGPIGIMLINWGADPIIITHGMRIAQLVVAPVIQAQFQLVSGLAETQRGSGGFGSTGTN